MALPNVNMAFAPGNQLQGAASANIDNVFMVVGAASKAMPNTVIPIVDPNTIPALAGYGPAAELCAQILANGAGTVYLVAGNKSAVDDDTYTYGIADTIYQSRPSGPALTVIPMIGLPGLPLQGAFANTGAGSIFFDSNTSIQGGGVGGVDIISAQITTAGGIVGVLTSSTAYGSGTVSGSTFALATGTPWMDSAFVGQFFVDKNGAAWPIVSNTTSALTVTGSPASGTNATSSIVAAGAALATIVVGSSTYTNVPLTNVPWVQPGAGKIILDFVLPASKQFKAGDYFSAVPTPNDSYNVIITIQSINSFGQALFTYSLDGGVTTSGQLSAPLGGVINASSGAPAVTWATGSDAPDAPENVSLICSQAGTLYGNGFQVGSVTHTGSGAATVAVGTLPATGSQPWTTAQTYVLNVSDGGATGTATGYWTLNGSTFSSGGTSGSPITIAATFTDSVNGITFDTSSTLATGDTYSVTIQPQALFTQTINGTVTNGVNIPSIGQIDFSGPSLQFNTNGVDQYTIGMSYQFWAYPSFAYGPQERDSSYDGFEFEFGFGAYQAGDTYQFQCAAPYVANADALNALSVITSSNGYPYSMIQFYTGVREEIAGNLIPDWATAMSLASSVNTALLALVPAPTFQFKRAFVCGPDATSATSGATPNDFINASGGLTLDRVMTGAGADQITSALTGRQDLRNHGVADIARLAAIPVQTDPGEYILGPLQNVVSTTTPDADATTFNGNRAMVARTFDGIPGVFEAEGLTLSTPGGDYSTVMNCRVIDKAAYYAQQALLPYGINRTVPTVPGKGTLTPAFANIINTDVAAQTTKSCPGNFQNITVSASTTAVLVPNGTEPVTIAIQPWGYINSINATIGFTL